MVLSITRIRRRNFQGLIVTILIALVATAAFNLVIDPYGTFRLIDIPGLNRIKPYPDHDLEIIKVNAMRHVAPDALILGNSRAEAGLDPTHPAWRIAGFQSVYNAGIAGSSASTARRVLKAAERTKSPKFVLLGTDFFDFLVAPDFKLRSTQEEPSQSLDTVLWKVRATLTMQATLDSATTLIRQFQSNPKQLTLLGHNPLREYRDIAKAEGYWALFRQRAEENVKGHGRKPKNLFLQGTRSSPDFEDIRGIVRWAVDNDVDLKIVIYPYHAQMLVMIDELGLWPLFEEWKRQLSLLIEEESANAKARIDLFDFSGFSEYSTEPIPSRNDRQTVTRWYWEAGHFKKELGDIMLERILNPQHFAGQFGELIRFATVEAHLGSIRNGKADYELQTTAVRAEIKSIITKLKQPSQSPATLQ